MVVVGVIEGVGVTVIVGVTVTEGVGVGEFLALYLELKIISKINFETSLYPFIISILNMSELLTPIFFIFEP